MHVKIYEVNGSQLMRIDETHANIVTPDPADNTPGDAPSMFPGPEKSERILRLQSSKLVGGFTLRNWPGQYSCGNLHVTSDNTGRIAIAIGDVEIHIETGENSTVAATCSVSPPVQ